MIDKFPWDHYSDQPHIIKDKAFKKSIYKKAIFDQILTLLTTLLLSPFIFLSYFLHGKKQIDTKHFFGMSVNLDKEPQKSVALIQELGVETLLMRFPLSQMHRLTEYVDFSKSFEGKDIMIVLLQDRAHIEDSALLKADIIKVFDAFSHVKTFQVGNAINRKKWAFYTTKEYLSFYKIIQDIRDSHYHDRDLIGSSVIDFEYHHTIRSLFHLVPIKYDIFSSLLYVDRRGSPENRQMGFDLYKKIKLLRAIMMLSPKAPKSLYITETNWPISNTAPYAPTSEKECVTPEQYALFMVLYHLISLASGRVDRVYWHQLIAPGYGLVDNRDGIDKYPAFKAYQTMVSLLQGAILKEANITSQAKFMRFEKEGKAIMIHWSDTPLDIKEGIGLYGEPFSSGTFCYVLEA